MYRPQDLTYGMVFWDFLNGPGARASHPQCREVRHPHAALCGKKKKKKRERYLNGIYSALSQNIHRVFGSMEVLSAASISEKGSEERNSRF